MLIFFIIIMMVFLYALVVKRVSISSTIGGLLGFAMFISSWIAYGDDLLSFGSTIFLTICSIVMIAVYSYIWLHDEVQKEIDIP